MSLLNFMAALEVLKIIIASSPMRYTYILLCLQSVCHRAWDYQEIALEKQGHRNKIYVSPPFNTALAAKYNTQTVSLKQLHSCIDSVSLES